ncbi:hypothetical protein G6O67_004663 [Ophiocordyceps sinensis]|uniref:Uncharacterized protein n=1 Tax=Ophiocordyceps sinensis TaxID=72228 RepID=A0A8H4PPZ0_9HYPO|nr:hypothetical protein G6O67_004663 [Ophiocordyceps sinensis]
MDAEAGKPAAGGLALADGNDGADEVVGDDVVDDAVVPVPGVGVDKVSDPAGRRVELAAGALADELEVGGELAARLDVDVYAVEVALDNGDEAGKRARGRAVDNLVNRHLVVLVLDGGESGGAAAAGHGRRGARRRVIFVAAAAGHAAKRGAGPRRPGRKGVLAKVKPLREEGVEGVGALHVLVDTLDGYVKVEVKGENGARDEHHEDGKGGIFKVGHLNLHGPELDAPANRVIGGGRLEAHVLPVCRLYVLKVVRLGKVKLPEVLGEDDNGVADEQVGKVRGEAVVHAAVEQLGLDIGVDDEVRVQVLVAQPRVRRDVRRVGGVARLWDAPPIVLQWLDRGTG